MDSIKIKPKGWHSYFLLGILKISLLFLCLESSAQSDSITVQFDGKFKRYLPDDLKLTKLDTLRADTLSRLGDFEYNQSEFRIAKKLYLNASEEYKIKEVHVKMVKSLNYSNYIDYVVLNDQISFFNNAKVAFDYASQFLKPTQEEYLFALDQLGSSNYSISNYTRALQIFHELLLIRQQNNEPYYKIVNNLKSIADCYKFIGDNKNAIAFYKKGRSLTPKKDYSLRCEINHSIARYYENTGEKDSALFYIKKNIPLLNFIKSKTSKAKYLLTTSELSSQVTHDKEAFRYLNEVSKHITNDFYRIYKLETEAKLAYNSKKYSESIEFLNQAHLLAENSDRKNTPSFKSKRLLNKFKAAKKIEDSELMIKTLEEGIGCNIIKDSIISLNNSENVSKLYINKLETVYFTNELASLYLKSYLSKNTVGALEKAFYYYNISVNLLLTIRQEISNLESKNDFSFKSQAIIEGAIQSAIKLYETSQNNSYLEKAFIFSEQNKALNLLESLNEKTAKSYTSISDSLLSEERELELKYNEVKKISFNKNMSSLYNYEDELNTYQLKIDQIKKKIERNYPKYYNLKYGVKQFSINELRNKKLKNNQAIIEYFFGEKNIYIFILTKDKIKVENIDIDSNFISHIDTLNGLISKLPSSRNAKKEFDSFIRVSSHLYNLILLPAVSTLDNKISKIAIVPDGELNLIPFEILLKNKSIKASYDLENLDYFFEDYYISYQYSAFHWDKINQTKNTGFEQEFLGFAPKFNNKFECNGLNFSELSCNDNEIRIASKYFKGQFFTDQEATTSNFQNYAHQAKVIHLATHACLDEQENNLNSIYFSNKDISIIDLNQYNINAELAVLSACNTGIGKFVHGDGVQSLAWSFIESGCKSTLMSMWSIDDCTTSDFMNYYYNYIHNNENKDIALQKAKIDFLNKAPKQKQHPFYWAAFISYGSMQPINSSSIIFNKIPVFILVFAIILFLIIRIKQNRSTNTKPHDK